MRGHDLPPYAVRVLNLLRKRGRVTWKLVFTETRLPGNLVTAALKALEDRGLVEKLVDENGRVEYVLKK